MAHLRGNIRNPSCSQRPTIVSGRNFWIIRWPSKRRLLEEALAHIARYSSKHSESIITENESHKQRFAHEVDAACVYTNVSTAFTDGGQFGFGAEIGISTQKLHARGPMALPELTTYKYIISGNGQTRQ